jgi:hypothetical protein
MNYVNGTTTHESTAPPIATAPSETDSASAATPSTIRIDGESLSNGLCPARDLPVMTTPLATPSLSVIASTRMSNDQYRSGRREVCGKW